MSAHLDAMVRSHADRRPRGITSVCSAHPLVLEAALVQGRDDAAPVLIEATSNQVDQFGAGSHRQIDAVVRDDLRIPLDDSA